MKNLILFALLALTLRGFGATASTDIPLSHPFYKDLPLFLSTPLRLPFDAAALPLSKDQAIVLLKSCVLDSTYSYRSIAQGYLAEFQNSGRSQEIKKNLLSFSVDGDSNGVIFYPFATFAVAVQDSHFNKYGVKTFRKIGDTLNGKVRLDSMGSNPEGTGEAKTGVVIDGHIGSAALYFKGCLITRYASREAWRKTTDPKNGDFLSNIFEKENVPGHLTGSDEFISFVNFPLSFMTLKLGRDAVSWGASEENNLLFSGNAKPFLHARATQSIGPIHFQYVFGKLTADSYAESRLVYAKRFSWDIRPWLTIGFSDMVLTINRPIEALYFLPVVPFFFSEHYVGDLDNRLMCVDGKVNVKGLFSVYAQFLLDDMRNFAAIFDDSDVANKWALTTGIRLNKSPWPRALASATLEYSRVEPWVYTTSARDNRDSLNTRIFNYPVHFGSLLGNPMGPNSQRITLTTRSRLSEKWNTELKIEKIQKGSGPGSSISDINTLIPDTLHGGVVPKYLSKKEVTLKNLVVNRTLFQGSVDYRPILWSMTSASCAYIHEAATNSGNYFQVKLSTTLNF